MKIILIKDVKKQGKSGDILDVKDGYGTFLINKGDAVLATSNSVDRLDRENKEKEVKELQRKRFGSGGDLEKKREELMKPIQDKVYNAIEKAASAKNYAFILDKAGSATLLYVDPKCDISDDILTQLGYGKNSKK